MVVTGPLLHSVAQLGGQATFTGRAYRVFYKDEVDAPAWTQLGSDFVAANSLASISHYAGVPRRFYRVLQVN